MQKSNNNKLRVWETALLFSLCFTLCTGVWAQARQCSLSNEVIRLHVIANSDSDADQSVKLRVRDAVLEKLSPALKAAETRQQAEGIVVGQLPEIQRTAAKVLEENGFSYSAASTLSVETYPTREYDGFALPAGDYLSLRVVLGSGRGHNWWCVVFPPLCMSSCEDESAFSALSEDNRELIVSDDGGYCVKFKIVELYEQIRQALTAQ